MKNFVKWIQGLKLNIKFTALIILVIAIPIGIMSGVMYYNMEQNVVEENITYMNYNMERNQTQVSTNIDALNMSTQFMVSDSSMMEVLRVAANNGTLSTSDLLTFYENDIASVERLINNNPLLYSIRVYATNDNVQEMMPVLYRKNRMQRMEWAKGTEEEMMGWHFGYHDEVFSTLLTNQDSDLLGLVTPIKDYEYGTVGMIEVSMNMKTMFPTLYEQLDNEWSCLVSSDGVYYGDNKPEDAQIFLENLWASISENYTDSVDAISSATLEGRNYCRYYESDGRKYVISYMPIRELKATVVSVRDITKEVHRIYDTRNIFVISAIIMLAIVSIFINFIVKQMLRQLYSIIDVIGEVKAGDLGKRIEHHTEDEMGILSGQLNGMLDRIEKLMQENIDREVLIKNSEIRALQNQINAHFIYNVLETIKMMAEIDEKYEISDAITSLGKLLRYSMRWVSGNVKVNEELEYIKNYVALINLRFDYEIILSVNIPEEMMLQDIPKMSLQPIVENAILHGIEDVAEDTTIYIKGYADGKDCVLEITDAGKGMTEAQVEALEKKIAGEIETTGGSGNGIGLKNVQDRITIAFGEGYGLSVFSQLDCYTKIMVRIPLTIGKGKNEDSINS